MTTEHNPFNTVSVIVRGAGGLINDEMIRIQKHFEELGYKVHVTNDYPHQSQTGPGWAIKEPMTDDQYLAYINQQDRTRREIRGDAYQQRHMHLIAEHCPWGG